MSLRTGIERLSWLLRRTSLLTQIVHSLSSFLLMASMARLAQPEVFALAAAFFLLVTLCSSLNTYVLNAAWLREEGEGAPQRIERFSRLLAFASTLAFALFWLGYRHWAFGAAPAWELPWVTLAAYAYLRFFALRRQLLLDGNFARVGLADVIRAALIGGGGWMLLSSRTPLTFESFLGLFLGAHLLGLLPMRSWARGLPGLKEAWSPAARIRRDDWLSVGAGAANVMFSQLATVLAPMLVSATEYATLRAYELFLLPVFFMAQILDPLCMRQYRAMNEMSAASSAVPQRRALLKALAVPGLLIFAPLALVCLVAWTWAPAAELLQSLIAPDYRPAFWLMVPVLVLSGLVGLNAPLRWYTIVVGLGKPLVMGTALGIALSLALLFALSHLHYGAAAVFASKIVYEIALAVLGVLGLWAYWRKPA